MFDWNFMNNTQKWEQIKYQRNLYLQQSDWTQLPDTTLTEEKKQEWQNYRQALRDIPQNFQNPDDVVYARPSINFVNSYFQSFCNKSESFILRAFTFTFYKITNRLS